ncbi:MAG: SpoIIE family protein phosphatase, partial [Gammaproteobacteria bacterium]|nr:SpoIIE family protein phosphatase [Gammaproteobacteria bacterium]
SETLEHNRIQKIALDQLEIAKNDLEELNNSLEIKVAERTRELAEINQYTRESIEYASLIQHALIVEPKIFNNYFEQSFAIWNPKDIVGGDIYLIEALNENEILIMLIDCTGHGVPGAFVTMLVKAIERQIVSKIYQTHDFTPGGILESFNNQIKSLLKQEDKDSVSNAGFDGAIIHYNKENKELNFASANTPLFICKNQEVKIIKGDRYSIGYNSSERGYQFKNQKLTLTNDDTVYVTSDGYLDQIGGDRNFPYGKKRFKSFLSTVQNFDMAKQEQLFIDEIMNYQQGLERVDDVTVIGFKIK